MDGFYLDWKIDHYGLCCTECDKKDNCPSVCELLYAKRMTPDSCDSRVNYKECLEIMLEDKRELLVDTKNNMEKLTKEIAKIEGIINIKSPLDCKFCGSKNVEYNTISALLSNPPKYKGVCDVCNKLNYVNVQVYRETMKKK